MLLLCGAIPNKDLACTFGPVTRDGDYLMADGQRFSGTQGTGAMISAALAITTYFQLEPPHVLIAGDIGDGRGTRAIPYMIISIRIWKQSCLKKSKPKLNF